MKLLVRPDYQPFIAWSVVDFHAALCKQRFIFPRRVERLSFTEIMKTKFPWRSLLKWFGAHPVIMLFSRSRHWALRATHVYSSLALRRRASDIFPSLACLMRQFEWFNEKIQPMDCARVYAVFDYTLDEAELVVAGMLQLQLTVANWNCPTWQCIIRVRDAVCPTVLESWTYSQHGLVIQVVTVSLVISVRSCW